jgi:hypothetical protein
MHTNANLEPGNALTSTNEASAMINAHRRQSPPAGR